MSDDYISEFGRIEKIVEKHFINGQVWNTRFVMGVFSTQRSLWTGMHKCFDFYGEIPLEYVGQNGRYFSATHDGSDISNVIAEIEIGLITPRRDGSDGVYDIVPSEPGDPTVPRKIRSQLLKSVNGHVIFPFEYLKNEK